MDVRDHRHAADACAGIVTERRHTGGGRVETIRWPLRDFVATHALDHAVAVADL